jgi:hypothetical protein
MARRSNKLVIRVLPNRTNENVTFGATGHFGKLVLGIPATYIKGTTLSPTTDKKAYWNDVLIKVQAKILSL